MSDSDDDYMSAAFLAPTTAQKRPGLIHGQRARELIKETRIKKMDEDHREMQRKKARKPVIELMKETREDSLNMHMSEANPDNKGLKLMMKMGFKPGTGLGSEGQGRKNPVEIGTFKIDKKGIGQDVKEAVISEQERKETEKNFHRLAELRRQSELMNKDSFELYNKEKRLNHERCRFIRQAQKAAFDLDDRNGLANPTERLFWPSTVVKTVSAPKRQRMIDRDDKTNELVEEDEEEPEFEPAILLNDITGYLRTTYFYCIYCGATYSNGEDLEANCPGNDITLHDEEL